MRKCKCGCGEITKLGNKYIHNHHSRGIKRSKETKHKIGLANKGMKFSEESKKNLSLVHVGFTGMRHTEEAKRKVSLAKKGIRCSEETKRKLVLANTRNIKCRTDGYCDAWSDGEYKDDLREDVCSDCGMTMEESLDEWGEVLSLHHKDGNKKNCHPDNFDTLCRSCHSIADWELKEGGCERRN